MQKSSTKLLYGVLIGGLHYITYRQSSPFALWQVCFFLWIWTWRLFLSFEGDKTEGSSPSWVDKNPRILNTRCLRVLKLSTWNVEEIYVGLHETENFQSWKGAFLGGRMVGQSEIVRMQYIGKQKSKGS